MNIMEQVATAYQKMYNGIIEDIKILQLKSKEQIIESLIYFDETEKQILLSWSKEKLIKCKLKSKYGYSPANECLINILYAEITA